MNSRGWKRPDPFPGFLNEGEADTRRRAESKIGGEEREREVVVGLNPDMKSNGNRRSI